MRGQSSWNDLFFLLLDSDPTLTSICSSYLASWSFTVIYLHCLVDGHCLSRLLCFYIHSCIIKQERELHYLPDMILESQAIRFAGAFIISDGDWVVTTRVSASKFVVTAEILSLLYLKIDLDRLFVNQHMWSHPTFFVQKFVVSLMRKCRFSQMYFSCNFSVVCFAFVLWSDQF